MCYSVESSVEKGTKLKHFVSSGSSLNMLLSILEPKRNIFRKTELSDLYERIKQMPRDTIMTSLGIRKEEASVLVPTLVTYLTLMEYVETSTVKFTRQTFPHTLSLFYSRAIRDRGDLYIGFVIRYTDWVQDSTWTNSTHRPRLGFLCSYLRNFVRYTPSEGVKN